MTVDPTTSKAHSAPIKFVFCFTYRQKLMSRYFFYIMELGYIDIIEPLSLIVPFYLVPFCVIVAKGGSHAL